MRLKLKREWTIGEPIGAGGFGKVYVAKSSDGETAVVKMVPKAPGAQRELLFENLNGIRNVVPIIDSGETKDSWVLVMPKAEKSLRKHLEEAAGPLDVSDATATLLDIAEALTELDGKVVHSVGAVIVGARLGDRGHRADNLRLFSFALDAEDHARIAAAIARARRIAGDCGSEYRRPPYLTATGDLSHHLASFPKVYRAEPMPERPDRLRIDTGSVWEPICGYSRAVRIGGRILVSGTTATHGSGGVVCPGDAGSQAVYILDKIQASIEALGGALEDVIRTRIFVSDQSKWEAVARVHGRYLGHVRPANTLVEVSALVGNYDVEIEAEAVVDAR
jgi:enamine deaminase RidA (YjgF/YER057c/UK114 family)